MVLTALRGALGFLTRLPVGQSERAWTALGTAPAAMVPVGYLVGGLAGVPLLFALPPPTLGVLYMLALLGLTGVAHADGLADVGDAAVVHGPPAERRAVMGDTVTGVGGTVAVGVDLVGLGLAGLALGTFPLRVAVGLVVAAEVGAKLGMLVVAAFGRATHAGLGSHLTGSGPATLAVGVVLAAPAAALAWPSAASAVGLAAALAAAALVLLWARSRLGGVNGDVLGATNELARLAALHAGVVAWTLS